MLGTTPSSRTSPEHNRAALAPSLEERAAPYLSASLVTITDIARATQAAAAHVIATQGVKSPAALALLLAAAATTGVALNAGHPVHDIHPPPRTPDEDTHQHREADTA